MGNLDSLNARVKKICEAVKLGRLSDDSARYRIAYASQTANLVPRVVSWNFRTTNEQLRLDVSESANILVMMKIVDPKTTGAFDLDKGLKYSFTGWVQAVVSTILPSVNRKLSRFPDRTTISSEVLLDIPAEPGFDMRSARIYDEFIEESGAARGVRKTHLTAESLLLMKNLPALQRPDWRTRERLANRIARIGPGGVGQTVLRVCGLSSSGGDGEVAELFSTWAGCDDALIFADETPKALMGQISKVIADAACTDYPYPGVEARLELTRQIRSRHKGKGWAGLAARLTSSLIACQCQAISDYGPRPSAESRQQRLARQSAERDAWPGLLAKAANMVGATTASVQIFVEMAASSARVTGPVLRVEGI